MNRLPSDTRAAIIRGMVESNSIRSIVHMTYVSKSACLRLFAQITRLGARIIPEVMWLCVRSEPTQESQASPVIFSRRTHISRDIRGIALTASAREHLEL